MVHLKSLKTASLCEALTLKVMYDADEFAQVPADFRRMGIDEAKSSLVEQATEACDGTTPVIDWQFHIDHSMTYGQQTYWISAHFTCSEIRPAMENAGVTCRRVGSTYAIKCCDSSGCWIE